MTTPSPDPGPGDSTVSTTEPATAAVPVPGPESSEAPAPPQAPAASPAFDAPPPTSSYVPPGDVIAPPGASSLALATAMTRSDFGWLLLLLIATAVAFYPGIYGGWLWDDAAITENYVIRSFSNLQFVWTTPGSIQNEIHWWPLTYTSLAVDFAIGQLDPFVYHVGNLLIYLAGIAALWNALRRLQVPHHRFVMALFALHPMHVESVAWGIGRKDVLCGLMAFLALHFYARFLLEQQRVWFYRLSLVCFTLALLSKSTAIGFPLVILLIGLWKHGRLRWAEIAQSIPFILIALTHTIIDTLWVTLRLPYHTELTMPERLGVVGRALWFYLGKALAPYPLITVYPRWDAEGSGWTYTGSLLLVVAAVLALWLLRRRLGIGLFVCYSFYLICVFPVSGIVDFTFMDQSFVADRYMFFGLLGVLIPVTCGLMAIINRFRTTAVHRFFVFAVILLVYGVITHQQTKYYKDLETLFRHTLAHNPRSHAAQNNLGTVLLNRGELDEALQRFQACLALRPRYTEALANEGLTYANMGRWDEAERSYRLALEGAPNLAGVWSNLALAAIQNKRLNQALEYLQRAYFLDSTNMSVLVNLASAYEQLGRYNEAMQVIDRALALDSLYGPAYTMRGAILRGMGKDKEAETWLYLGVQKGEGFRDCWGVLAKYLVDTKQFDRAEPVIVELLRRYPRDLDTIIMAARMYNEQNRHWEAANAWSRVVELVPRAADAAYEAGAALDRFGMYKEAANAYTWAVQLTNTWVKPLNDLAWLRATHPDAALRDGAEAVRLATEAAQNTNWRDPAVLDTLGAALAESGRYDDAITTATFALNYARESTATLTLVPGIIANLNSYKQGKPVRMEVRTPIRKSGS